ncbi:callose synthase [Striga asiatica]|uniref:Callose synthase n=1 Tax=Striga asiatica TaxID=4170 RepID=A0A5A7PP25_STRAF|nr:callose synthase [Striga asiatica]
MTTGTDREFRRGERESERESKREKDFMLMIWVRPAEKCPRCTSSRGKGKVPHLFFLLFYCEYLISFNMAYELYGLLAGKVSTVTREIIKPSYGGDDEAFLRKVITPIYQCLYGYQGSKKDKNGIAPHTA